MKIRTTLLFMMGLFLYPFYWLFKDCLKKLDDKVALQEDAFVILKNEKTGERRILR